MSKEKLIDEEINSVSMQIILKAGDARTLLNKAVEAALNNHMEDIEKDVKNAEDLLVEAHQLQTMIIQNSISEDHSEYSMLFSHAQDTLMTINSELIFSKYLIALARKVL